jgi:nucleoid DNA-binding protein
MGRMSGNLGGDRDKVKYLSLTTDITLVHRVAQEMGIQPEDALMFINVITDKIVETVTAQGYCNIRKLGLFRLSIMKNCRYYDKSKKSFTVVPLRYATRFKASEHFKSSINAEIKKKMQQAIRTQNETGDTK